MPCVQITRRTCSLESGEVSDPRFERTVTVSVIVPAFNEARYLPRTLDGIRVALSRLTIPTEIIVVDNDSEDDTSRVGMSHGAIVVFEREHNIGKVRNTGARAATGTVLVFIDADTVVPA